MGRKDFLGEEVLGLGTKMGWGEVERKDGVGRLLKAPTLQLPLDEYIYR